MARSDDVDLRPVKARAAELLPPDNPHRQGIAALPDWMPREEALVVIRFYIRHFASVREGSPHVGH